jgi:hypothetical protein
LVSSSYWWPKASSNPCFSMSNMDQVSGGAGLGASGICAQWLASRKMSRPAAL